VRRAPPWAAPGLAAAIAAAYLLWQPPSADLAAAVYRIGQFSRDGFVLYDPQWYAGYDPLGYSLLLGPLGAVLGARLLAAAAAVAAAALFARLVDSTAAALWLAAGIGISLGSGRVAFTLGVAIALGALVAARRRRTALVLAALSGLASPLAGAFLGLAAVAGASGQGRRARIGLALAAVVPAGALALAFPTAGYEPFAGSSFWPAFALIAIVAAVAPPLRAGAALYGLFCLAAFALQTPVGGNAVRLGALFAGPLALVAVRDRRALAVLALPLLYWQLQAPIRDVVTAAGDPSTTAAYYAPLERYLAGRPPTRIEVPFTRQHWEAALLAPTVGLARGWERQLDIADNGLFYRPGLTAAAYGAWLRSTAVSLVALPDAQLDYSARAEAALIRAGQPYLRPVARLRHWRVYAVVGAAPLASPPATLTELGPNAFTLRFARAGTSLVRLRFSDHLSGCVRTGPGGFTEVTAARPGRVRVAARLDLGDLLERGRACGAGVVGAAPVGSAATFGDRGGGAG
jgi:hypothetical protein